MNPFSIQWTFPLAAVLALPNCFAAAPTPAESVPNAPAASAEQIAGWIRQLDSPRFAERTEATRRLEEAGKDAFPALIEAAVGDSREATLRAIEILRKHSQEGDESLPAAKEALQKIAASEHPSAARRAKEALAPPAPSPPKVPAIQLGPIVPKLPAGQQQVQVQIQINAFGGNQTRRIQIKNGVQETEVAENDLKVKITEDDRRIQMEITRKKDGKETTEKYSARTADELKKRHPEAGRLYDKYGQQFGGIHIRAIQAAPGR
ncbi:MAG: hypothetical protein GX575_24695 [Candidatus Anammoximicrobium sp.]|nr:hypothetical protein [Candidatus Anammoximicrobium sp.]